MTNSNTTFHTGLWLRLGILVLALGWSLGAQAQTQEDFFEFEEDTLRMQMDCPDLAADEAEYIFFIDRPDLAISGIYTCDSIAPSFQYIENEYQYLVRLRQLKHEKKRSLRFGLHNTTYEGVFKLSARRQSRHFIRIVPRDNFIRLTEASDGYSIEPGNKNAVKVVFRTPLDLSIESPDLDSDIRHNLTNVNLKEYTVIVNSKDIDPDGSMLYITTSDGTSNTISVNLGTAVPKIKSEKTYEVSLAEYQKAGKPASRNLNFQVYPDDVPSIVYLDGNQLDAGANSRFVFIGRHDIRVEAPNYHVLDTFVVMDDPVNDKNVVLTLHPQYGDISVEANQLKGSTVILDGVEMGRTPITLEKVASGRHYLEVAERSYITYQTIVNVVDGQTAVVKPQFVKRTKSAPKPAERPVTVRVAPAKAHPYVVIRTSDTDSVIVEINRKGEGQVFLEPGSYRYNVSAPNYHVMAGTLIVDKATPASLTANLKPRFGKVSVESKTLRGAAVSIDGSQSDRRIPCTFEYVPSGVHYVQIVPREGLTLRKRIEVSDNAVTKVSDIKYIKNYVRLGFKAEDSVYILINGAVRGQGFVDSQPFKNSPVRITCRYEGYFDTTILFHFQLGDKDTVITLPKLRAKKGYLVASSIPSDAGIYVDDELVGKTPVSQLQVPIGPHKISINKAGFQGVDTMVTIKFDQPFMLQDIRLQKERRILNPKTIVLASFVPYSNSSNWYFWQNNAPAPVVGLTIGHTKMFGWYASAFTNFKFDFPDDAIDDRGYADNGNLVLFDSQCHPSLTYVSGTAGLIFRPIRPIWVYAGGGYAIKKTTVCDAQGQMFYLRSHSVQGICAEAGIGLALGPIAVTGGINVIDFKHLFSKSSGAACLTYRLGVGFAL